MAAGRRIGSPTFRGGTATFQKAERFSQGAAVGATFWRSMKAKISIQCVGLVRGSKALFKRCRRKRESAICNDCEQSVRKHANLRLLDLLKQSLELLKEDPLTIRQVEGKAEDVHNSILAHYDACLVPCLGIFYEYRNEELIWKRCGLLRDTGICGACLVKSTGFIRDNELQALHDVVKGSGPASQAALDHASAVSNLILARRQTDMRKKVEAALVRILWHLLSISVVRAARSQSRHVVLRRSSRRRQAVPEQRKC